MFPVRAYEMSSSLVFLTEEIGTSPSWRELLAIDVWQNKAMTSTWRLFITNNAINMGKYPTLDEYFQLAAFIFDMHLETRCVKLCFVSPQFFVSASSVRHCLIYFLTLNRKVTGYVRNLYCTFSRHSNLVGFNLSIIPNCSSQYHGSQPLSLWWMPISDLTLPKKC